MTPDRTDPLGDFDRLYDEWFGRVYAVAYGILRDSHEARDVSQEAFFTAWRKLADLRDPDKFGPWVLRIARNNALRHARTRRREEPVEQIETHAESGEPPEDRLTRVEDPADIASRRDCAALL